MAKVIIKRENKMGGSAINHNVYLDNIYVGVLKNGKVLNFDATVGPHTISFVSTSKLNKKGADFGLSVNTDDNIIEIKSYFDFNGNYIVEYADDKPHIANYVSETGEVGLKCPACGSTDLTTLSEIKTTGKDFNASNACCGYLLCGPLGLLMGVDKKGKQQHTESFWVCKKCGHKFKM